MEKNLAARRNLYSSRAARSNLQKPPRVYESPAVMDIRDYCAGELETLWDESRRLVNPQEVYVDLSKPLWDLKNELLDHVHNFEDNETKHA